jgi:hypothetical protein
MSIPTPTRIEHAFDPCRVGTILLCDPVALPPAIEFDAFGVKRDPKNGQTPVRCFAA